MSGPPEGHQYTQTWFFPKPESCAVEYKEFAVQVTREKLKNKKERARIVKAFVYERVLEYACAAINNGVNLILYLGVRNDGTIVGVEIDREMVSHKGLQFTHFLFHLLPFLFFFGNLKFFGVISNHTVVDLILVLNPIPPMVDPMPIVDP